MCSHCQTKNCFVNVFYSRATIFLCVNLLIKPCLTTPHFNPQFACTSRSIGLLNFLWARAYRPTFNPQCIVFYRFEYFGRLFPLIVNRTTLKQTQTRFLAVFSKWVFYTTPNEPNCRGKSFMIRLKPKVWRQPKTEPLWYFMVTQEFIFSGIQYVTVWFQIHALNWSCFP